MPTPVSRFVPPWLLYAIVAATCWGVWGVLSKGPSRELSGWMTQMLFTIALVPSVIFAGCSKNVRVGSNKPLGLFWGFVSGLIAAAGNIAFYLALENGADTSIAIPLTNIYPLVTIGIAYLWFGERLNWIQCSGILLAVIAIILLSGEARNLGDPVAVVKRIGLTPWMIYSFVALSKETVVNHGSIEVRNTVGESTT